MRIEYKAFDLIFFTFFFLGLPWIGHKSPICKAIKYRMVCSYLKGPSKL